MELKEILKYVFVIVALPVAVPFVKSLVRDLLLAFEEDGGLLGDPPSAAKLEEIQRAKRRRPNPLVSEPLAHIRKAARGPSNTPDGPGSGR